MKNPFLWTAVFLGATWWLLKGELTGWLALIVAIVALKSVAIAALCGYPKRPDNPWPLFLGISVRAILALVFVYHGLPKVLAGGVNPMGMPAWLLLMVGVVEVGGGIMMAMGPKKLRMLSALGMVVIMVVAIIQNHMASGFSFMAGGFEFQLVLLTLAYLTYLLSDGWCPTKEMALNLWWPKAKEAPAEGGWDAGAEG